MHRRQWQLGPVSIEQIEFESAGRDDTTAIRRGWQHLFQLLAELNTVLVPAGPTLLGQREGEILRGRWDSFVAETDVSLLWDAMRGLLQRVRQAAGQQGLAGWRQWRQLSRRVRSQFPAVRQTRRAKPPRVRAYWRSLKALDQAGLAESKIKPIQSRMAPAERQLEQSDRHLLQDERIPHEEQVRSLCEAHTGWIGLTPIR